MHYYFPIYINDRLIHICKLDEDPTPGTPFEFIIPRAERTFLFSIPVTGAKLLSNQGYKGNIQLSKLTPRITCTTKEEVRLDLYHEKLKATEDNGQGSPVVISGKWGNRNCAVMIDRTIMQANTSFTFTVCYHHGEKIKINKKITYRERVFSYSFTVHYCEADLVKQAALDFGSEASQARVQDNTEKLPLVNLPLINLMKVLHPNNQNAQDNNIDYWQGGNNNEFFKSVFFLCTEPKRPIEEFDIPNRYSENTFVQTLVPKTAELTNLFILPNLKLLDALQGNTNLNQHPIKLRPLAEGEEDAITRKNINEDQITLGAVSDMADLILEILLNNFMHCILKKLTPNRPTNRSTFLRLNMLMPNVYPQNKVYRVVKGLYAGFNAIKTKYPEYNCITGIEIQVLSESDAAFLGVRTINRWDYTDNMQLINKKGGYFLIIDAGKGTTDFSILRQQENCNVFDSVYRSGIPISGNYITYAFYEAVRDFCNQQGITLNDKLSKALNKDRAKILDFVDILEQMKCNYTFSTEPAADFPKIQNQYTLDTINKHLKTITKQKLPTIDKYVNDAVDKVVNWVATELNRYCKNHSMEFDQVMFTGRGFLFPPLREAMETKLKEMQLMGKNENVLFFNDNKLSKTICLDGAFLLEKSNRINQNSEMVGFPVAGSQSPGRLKKFFEKIFGSNLVDEKFFYKGIRISTPQPTIYVSGNQYKATENDRHEKRLLFVGDCFMLQYENHSDEFRREPKRIAKDDDVNRSLFPFFEGSIPETETIAGQGQQNDVVTNAAEQGQPNDGGSNAAEQGQPNDGGSNAAEQVPPVDIDDQYKAKAEGSEDKPSNPVF